MKGLINILGQHYYYSTINELIKQDSLKEVSAIIIEELYLEEFLLKGKKILQKDVDQIIIISENVDTAISNIEAIGILLISAESFENALKIASLSSDSCKEIICIVKEDENKISEILNTIGA